MKCLFTDIMITALRNLLITKIFSLGNLENLTRGCQNEYVAYNTILDDVKKKTNLLIVFINIKDSEYGCSASEIKDVVNDNKDTKFALVALNEKCMCDVNKEIYGNDNYVSTMDINENDIKKLLNIIKNH